MNTEAAPLGDHLREARRRLVVAAIAVVVASAISVYFSDYIMDVLRAPIDVLAQSRSASLNYDTVTGAFNLKLRIAIAGGAVLASPVILLELYKFLAPGLKRSERNYVLAFLISSLPLFLLGAAVGLKLFPHMIEVLTEFGSDQDSTLLQASYYVEFVMRIVIATGLAFVIPAILVLLNFLGLVRGRTLLKGWRLTVVAIATFSALATPAADVLSMALVAIPITGLFAVAISIALIHDRIAQKHTRAISDNVALPVT